jgi:hypothetical protein
MTVRDIFEKARKAELPILGQNKSLTIAPKVNELIHKSPLTAIVRIKTPPKRTQEKADGETSVALLPFQKG